MQRIFHSLFFFGWNRFNLVNCPGVDWKLKGRELNVTSVEKMEWHMDAYLVFKMQDRQSWSKQGYLYKLPDRAFGPTPSIELRLAGLLLLFNPWDLHSNPLHEQSLNGVILIWQTQECPKRKRICHSTPTYSAATFFIPLLYLSARRIPLHLLPNSFCSFSVLDFAFHSYRTDRISWLLTVSKKELEHHLFCSLARALSGISWYWFIYHYLDKWRVEM